MIVRDIITINGEQYEHIYSDCGMKLQKGEEIFDDVYNPIGSNREYNEVMILEEATEEDYIRILQLLGVEL